MRTLLILLFAALSFDGFNHIAKTNALKKKAEEAMLSGDFQTATALYHELIDSLKVAEDESVLNLSNAYFHLQDTTNAEKYYSAVVESQNTEIRAKANQQMGVIQYQKQDFNKALAHFKESLKADPNNAEARYNYELVKKVIENNKQQQDQNQEPDIPPLTPFAKQLKAKSDQLIAQKNYAQALQLMEDGLQQDPSVANYNDYIHRTRVVAEINAK
ncbi:M48 family metallopeptidase [Persicobacter sp. CCB-QB2]|uniref:tetratricopeptide repeat protein n=1 Tax=Persicobacter sp. CCB-QB2 TaxID=1561025 RepID=UPI0006A963D6|nr:tetratricopeptide repeat protein [Persicobacter sp. CCB-QB2]